MEPVQMRRIGYDTHDLVTRGIKHAVRIGVTPRATFTSRREIEIIR